jgi:putative ABC transport system permease protein
MTADLIYAKETRAPGWFKMVWTLARRELRGGVKGFRVFFLCLVLGVSAIASVGAVRTAFVRGLDAESRNLMGGDISVALTHRAMDEAEREFMEARGAVSYTAAMRSMARKVASNAEPLKPGVSRLIELKGVDAAYPLFGAVGLKGGGALHDALAFSGDLHGAVAEETLLTRLGLEPGDTIRIGTLEVEVRDILVDEPDRVAGGFNYGPRVMMSREGLEATGLVQTGSLITYRTRLALPPGSSGTDDLEAFKATALEAFPAGGWNIQDRRRSAPGVRFFMDRVAMFLTMIGLAALIVGGVGVSNAVSSYLASKREVIATLKCLGADGKTIFAVYLTQVLLMAVGAILVGLAIGAVTPFLIGSFLSDVLPIPVEFGLYPLAMIEAASFGILITLMFSLWPLGEARDLPPARLFRGWAGAEAGQGRKWPRWPVLAAIGGALTLMVSLAIFASGYPPFSAIFLAGTAVAMGGLALAGQGARLVAARLPRIARAGLRLAVSNLHRPGAATVSVVLSMGLGLTLLVIVVLVDGNLDHQIKEQIPEGAPSFFFVDIQKDDVDKFRQTVAANAGPHDLQLIPNMRGGIFALNGEEPDMSAIAPEVGWVLRGDRGLTYSAQIPTNSKVVEGEWWPEDYDGPPLVSMEADVARGLGLVLGDTIGINVLGRPIEARIANLRDLEWRAIAFNYVLVFPPSVLAGAPHTWIGNLTLVDGGQVAEQAAAEEAVHEAIVSAFPSVTIVRVKEALSSINDLMGDLIGGIRITSIVTMGAGVLVLAGALAAGHRRRLYDAVVLKVLGARRGFIARAFIMEFALLGLLTALIAAALGTFAAWLIMTQAMGTDWIFLPGRVAATILGAVGLTLGLGMFGTWSALGARPAEHLRSE